MATALPYLASYKNVPTLFDKIASAKIPEAFSQPYLYQTLGLKSKGDRALIPLLRTLGFIDAAGKPTSEYAALKNSSRARTATAAAIKRAYAPLFEANENANSLSGEELRGLVAQVAGTDDDMTKRIATTFSALVKLGDFKGIPPGPDADEDIDGGDDDKSFVAPRSERFETGLRPEFHYNIQVHLPSNATEEVYLSIFNALRKAFQ